MNSDKIDILTNIENNIKLIFLSYDRRFVNSPFKKMNQTMIDNIKEDLINNTRFSDHFLDQITHSHQVDIDTSALVELFVQNKKECWS